MRFIWLNFMHINVFEWIYDVSAVNDRWEELILEGETKGDRFACLLLELAHFMHAISKAFDHIKFYFCV